MNKQVTLTLDLPPEAEEVLRRLADSVGDAVETYVTRILVCSVRHGLNEDSPLWPLGISREEFHAEIRADRTAYLE